MTKIGIIGAMELEIEQLKNKLTNPKVSRKANMDFYEGLLNQKQVVIVKCGIGKVNAALCVQILADLFDVTHIINTGIAGSLNPKLDIGDILISKDAIHHDMDVTIFGYQKGEVPQMGFREFVADSNLVDLAMSSVQRIKLDVTASVGRVLSGDQFISSKEVKDKLISTFAGDCAEMEGASIAHGAVLNNIPFVIIRAISDKADDSAEMDYPTFEHAAALRSAMLVEDMIKYI